MKASQAARNALECVLDTVQGETIVIVCDDEKSGVGTAFADGALTLGLWTRLITLKTTTEIRRDVPAQLLELLTEQKPDIYINVLRGIREETPFRIKIIGLQRRDPRIRLGHCPGTTHAMLTEGALALTPNEHRKMQSFADRLMMTLNGAVDVEIANPAGTHLTFSVEGRAFFTDTRFDWALRKWMNLPTGEVIVAPLEQSLNGRLVCDMAIGGIGPISTPIEVTVKNGAAQKVLTPNKGIQKQVKDTLNTDEWSKLVGEFAFGINPQARLVPEFIECEKILGTTHIAFGHNLDMPGGRNASANHIDLLLSQPTVTITKADGSVVTVLEEGKFTT